MWQFKLRWNSYGATFDAPDAQSSKNLEIRNFVKIVTSRRKQRKTENGAKSVE
jgi:hypothetical protein